MLTLNDGRSELWQWDTNRKLIVDAECSQVHFSNKFFGRSIDVDVVDRMAVIPDILLQTDKELTAWAFVGTTENGYTQISKVFKVNKRNKPADYVFTLPEQTTLAEIMERLDDLESIGTNILFVDIAKDENDKYYSSHSASEIKAQLENGDFVVGRYGAKNLLIEEITEKYVSFVYHKPGGSTSEVYRVFDDKTVVHLSASHYHSEMVSTNTTQSLSNAQKSQARENIGAMSKDDVTDVVNEALKDVDGSAVLHSPQELTEEQKSQARENIGLENAVMGMLVELGIAPVLLDNDGAVLVDSDGVILLNK